ncbi:MAG: hypothetical protein ACLFVX_01530 [Archaeoglobaceae archaeon]
MKLTGGKKVVVGSSCSKDEDKLTERRVIAPLSSAIRILIAVTVLILFICSVSSEELGKVSNETQTCLNCHQKYTPGLVEDWRSSRHSSITPAEGQDREKDQRRLSIHYSVRI